MENKAPRMVLISVDDSRRVFVIHRVGLSNLCFASALRRQGIKKLVSDAKRHRWSIPQLR